MQHRRREYNIVILGAGGVGKSCLTGSSFREAGRVTITKRFGLQHNSSTMSG
ncbi:Ras- protein rsr1 [Maublancomyces gigas]|uniref:Ras- protein rsr1 n=1 Tax=Discina gigas TaxID=1032678 RepID=A0ABR3GP62_9PEZI